MYSIHGLRNPVLSFSDTLSNNSFTIQTIGDPHIGKQFKNNVPKSRLGERENTIFLDFIHLLNTSANVVVICGDLFDKTNIDNSTLLRCIAVLEKYVDLNPKTNYFILAGNHDLSKNSSIKSSFDVLTKYFTTNKKSNLTIVSDKIVTKKSDYFKINLIFVPYVPIEDTLIDYRSFTKDNYKNIIFGHWDTIDFNNIGNSSKYTSNVIPNSLLCNNNIIVTGHEHLPKQIKYDDYEIIVTGSLQPYSHAECIDTEDLYVTHTLQEVKDNLQDNDLYYNGKNLRILLNIDDELPELNNKYLSISYKYLPKELVEIDEESEVTSPVVLSFSDMLYTYLKDNPSSFNSYIETAYLNKSYSNWEYNNESN